MMEDRSKYQDKIDNRHQHLWFVTHFSSTVEVIFLYAERSVPSCPKILFLLRASLKKVESIIDQILFSSKQLDQLVQRTVI
jgi:hypothetical protein